MKVIKNANEDSAANMQNAIESVRVLADYVLVKQVMKKRKGRIITDAASNDKDKFDYSFEIVQLGDSCTKKINIGETPVFSNYVTFSGLKVIEKDENGMTSLVIVHENDIIAIDNEPKKTTVDESKN